MCGITLQLYVSTFSHFQANRTVLHYVARCSDEEVRMEIFDECIMNGADKFAKDSVNNKNLQGPRTLSQLFKY